MKLSTASRKKAFPLILMYSIASILCCLTVPLMVPMVTAPDDVTIWVENVIKEPGGYPNLVEVDIYINATGDTAIIGWKIDIAVNPDVLKPGYLFDHWYWAVAGVDGFFLWDWADFSGNSTSFDQGKNSTAEGTITDIVETVDNWGNFPRGTGANGTNKLLCVLYFTNKSASAYSPIRIKNAKYYTSCYAPDPDERPANVIHGHYNSPIHDVVVRSFATSAPSVNRGDIGQYFRVETYNPGGYTEKFNVTFSYNKTESEWEFIGNYTFTLDPLENKIMKFLESPAWDTEYTEPGNYTIKATATLNVTDINPADNVANTTMEIKPPPYDVAVTAISANTTTATAGETVEINVTAANLGTAEPVNLTVTVSYDSTEIGEDNATLVDPNTTRDFTFNWNTGGVSPGPYNITASVSLWTKEGWIDKIGFNDENKTTITIKLPHDVAVTAVSAPPEATVEDLVPIYVTVVNNGLNNETVTLTVSYGTTVINTTTFDLANGTDTTVELSWNTTDVPADTYTINATATIALEEYPYDNTKTTTIELKPLGGDVAVTNVVSSESQAYQPWTIQVNVTVKNNATGTISFNITAYYGSSTWYKIGTQNVTDLAEGESTTLTFDWALTDVALGLYTIKANATLIDLEDTYPDNNEFVDGQVFVKMPGDANGDRWVDGIDLVMELAPAFNSHGPDIPAPGAPASVNWNPDCDFNGDGWVDGVDLVMNLAPNFNKSY